MSSPCVYFFDIEYREKAVTGCPEIRVSHSLVRAPVRVDADFAVDLGVGAFAMRTGEIVPSRFRTTGVTPPEFGAVAL